MKKKRNIKKEKNEYPIYLIPLRYFILLVLVLSFPLFYYIFFNLTFYSSVFLFRLFYQVGINGDFIILNSKNFIRIIPSCVAVSAYLLLLILNLSVRMDLKKRIKTIFISFLILFLFNVLRIFLFGILVEKNFLFFDFAHKFFWYFVSTIFVVLIWFFMIKKFSINEIPFYSDLKLIIDSIKRK